MTAIRDRRIGHRFPLRLAIRYRPTETATASDWTLGEVVNISSAGLLFTTSEAVKPGEAIEALVAWPVALDRHVRLKLVIKGRALRCEGGLTAMYFNSY